MPILSKTGLLDGVFAEFEAMGYYLEGTAGADTIYGSLGADYLSGLGGNDRLYGGGGNDQIFGGSGNDFMVGGTGADAFDGGTGNDTVSYASATAGVTVDLALGGTGGEAAGDTFVNVEKLIGSAHADTLIGNAGSNTLEGGAGGDFLSGGGGVDFLFGGIGQDLLEGGAGVDFLFGGAEGDQFKLTLETDGSVDVVADFEAGIDTLNVAGLGATFRTNYHTRLSFSEGTTLPTDVTFNRNTSYQNPYGGSYVNHLFFDTDDGQLYLLKPDVQGYGRYQVVTGFDTIRVAAVEGADHLSPLFGAFLV